MTGARLLAVAARILDERTLQALIEPTIADLQHEAGQAPGRHARVAALARGYLAFARVFVVALSWRVPMRKLAVSLAVCAGVTLVLVAGLGFMIRQVIFLGVCGFLTLPFALAVVLFGRSDSEWRTLETAFTAVPLGFLTAGLVGWMLVPAVWPASFWTTVDASMNAARYGGQFEHLAEHALFHVVYLGMLGALLSAAASIVALRRRAGRIAPAVQAGS